MLKVFNNIITLMMESLILDYKPKDFSWIVILFNLFVWVWVLCSCAYLHMWVYFHLLQWNAWPSLRWQRMQILLMLASGLEHIIFELDAVSYNRSCCLLSVLAVQAEHWCWSIKIPRISLIIQILENIHSPIGRSMYGIHYQLIVYMLVRRGSSFWPRGRL